MTYVYALCEWVCLTLAFLLMPFAFLFAGTFDGLTKAREYFRAKRREAR